MKKYILSVLIIALLLFISACQEVQKEQPKLSLKTNSNKMEETSLQPKTETLKDIIKYLYLSKDELLKELGNNYEIVDTGAEGVLKGYYYKDLGITITFSDENKSVFWIDCDEKVDINGARAGMNFAEIQAILGKAAIEETWEETPTNKAYAIMYTIGKCNVTFKSFQKDGSNSMVSIMANSENDI